MAYTYAELKRKTLAELREIAKDVEHDAVQGYSQLNKDHLLPALCTALGVSMHKHHVIGDFDKPALKARMKKLKSERAAALKSGDRETLKAVRRHLRALNHQIRAHVS
jgi:DNA-binding IclR family transcriptional regulator